MTSTLKSRTKKLPDTRRNKIRRRAQELIAKETKLRDLTKSQSLIQPGDSESKPKYGLGKKK